MPSLSYKSQLDTGSGSYDLTTSPTRGRDAVVPQKGTTVTQYNRLYSSFFNPDFFIYKYFKTRPWRLRYQLVPRFLNNNIVKVATLWVLIPTMRLLALTDKNSVNIRSLRFSCHIFYGFLKFPKGILKIPPMIVIYITPT